ncbi:MAG TPA: hypothetical protein VGC50_14200 [Gammaproteobacteria bacterium]|jgi:hypothetical protein
MNIRKLRALSALPVIAALAACAAYPRTEADFGNSVRHMVRSQTVVTGPVDTAPVESGDGERLNGVLEAYRTDVSRTEEAPPPVAVQFGGTPQSQ